MLSRDRRERKSTGGICFWVLAALGLAAGIAEGAQHGGMRGTGKDLDLPTVGFGTTRFLLATADGDSAELLDEEHIYLMTGVSVKNGTHTTRYGMTIDYTKTDEKEPVSCRRLKDMGPQPNPSLVNVMAFGDFSATLRFCDSIAARMSSKIGFPPENVTAIDAKFMPGGTTSTITNTFSKDGLDWDTRALGLSSEEAEQIFLMLAKEYVQAVVDDVQRIRSARVTMLFLAFLVWGVGPIALIGMIYNLDTWAANREHCGYKSGDTPRMERLRQAMVSALGQCCTATGRGFISCRERAEQTPFLEAIGRCIESMRGDQAAYHTLPGTAFPAATSASSASDDKGYNGTMTEMTPAG